MASLPDDANVLLSATSSSRPSTPWRFDAVRYYIAVNVYVVAILCLFGIVGNVVSVVVLGRDRSIRRTTGLLLRALGLADTAYLVLCLLFQTVKTIHKYTEWLPDVVHRAWPYAEPYVWPLASIAQTCNVWLVVVLTADRYIAICRALHAAHYSTMSRVRAAIIFCWLAAIVYNLPRFFERATVHQSPLSSNASSSAAVVDRTALRENSVYIIVYKTALFFVARFLLPFSALAYFNTRLILAIKASARLPMKEVEGRRRHMRRRERYTLTLVVVVIVFVLCELPDLFLRS